MEAAAAASSRFAYLEAAMQYRLALNLTSGHAKYRRLECECYIGLAESLTRTGDRSSAWTACTEAATLARLLAAPDLLARAALSLSPGFLSIETGFYDPEHVHLLQEAIESNSSAAPALQVELLSRLVTALYWSESDSRGPSISAEAVRLAELAGDNRSLALALHARHSALWHPDFTDERTAIARRLVALSRETDDIEGSLIYRAGLITDLAEVGSRAALAVRLKASLATLEAPDNQIRCGWHRCLSRLWL